MRPGPRERSRARQSVPEAAAWQHDGRKDTWCAATRTSIQTVLELGRLTWWPDNAMEHLKKGAREGPAHGEMRNVRRKAKEKRPATVSDMLNGIIKRIEGLPRGGQSRGTRRPDRVKVWALEISNASGRDGAFRGVSERALETPLSMFELFLACAWLVSVRAAANWVAHARAETRLRPGCGRLVGRPCRPT